MLRIATADPDLSTYRPDAPWQAIWDEAVQEGQGKTVIEPLSNPSRVSRWSHLDILPGRDRTPPAPPQDRVGGGVTPAVLSHNRAYGSVPWRFMQHI